MTQSKRTILVFVRCAMGKTYDVAAQIADLDAAPYVYSLSGEYDIFCMFHLPSDDDIGRFIGEQVQTIEGVTGTNTLVCFNPFTKDKGFEDA